MADELGSNSRALSVIVWSTVTVAIAAFVVILRIITRWKILNFLGKDDWFILVAVVRLNSPRRRPARPTQKANPHRTGLLHRQYCLHVPT